MGARAAAWPSAARRARASASCAPTLAASASASATSWATPPGPPTASSQPPSGLSPPGKIEFMFNVLSQICIHGYLSFCVSDLDLY